MTSGTIWRAEQTPLDKFDLIEIEDVCFQSSGTLGLDIAARGSTRRFHVCFPLAWAFDFTDEFFDAMTGQQGHRGQFIGSGKLYRADETTRAKNFAEAVRPSFAEHAVELAEFYLLAMSSSVSVVCQRGYQVTELAS